METVDAAQNAAARRSKDPAASRLRLWLRVIGRVLHRAVRADFSLIAAGDAFYGLLSLAPALAALTTFYGWVADPADVRTHLALVEDVAPPGVHDVVASQAGAVLSTQRQTLGWASLLGLAAAVWTARLGVQALMSGIATAYREPQGRNFLSATLVTYAMTSVLIVAAATALGVVVVIPALVALLPLGPMPAVAATLAPWPIALLAIIVALSLLYRHSAAGRAGKSPFLTAGAVAATALWLVGSIALSAYVARFGAFNETYGALGGVAGLLLWFWLSALAALFGAALNAELECAARGHTNPGHGGTGPHGAQVADFAAAQRRKPGATAAPRE